MRARWVPAVLVALLVITSCGSSGVDRGSASAGGLRAGGLDTAGEVPSEALTGQRFIDFDNEEGTFARFGGKPLVVNFWASTCVPCITEMPEFEQVYQEVRQTVGFVGVNVIDIPSEATRMARQTGVTYPLVRDRTGALLRFVGGVGMPTTAFVDRDGQVVKVISRRIPLEELRAEVAALQAQDGP